MKNFTTSVCEHLCGSYKCWFVVLCPVLVPKAGVDRQFSSVNHTVCEMWKCKLAHKSQWHLQHVISNTSPSVCRELYKNLLAKSTSKINHQTLLLQKAFQYKTKWEMTLSHGENRQFSVQLSLFLSSRYSPSDKLKQEKKSDFCCPARTNSHENAILIRGCK